MSYQERNEGYMTASKFKRFIGMKGNPGCEARAMAIEAKEWVEPVNDAMLVGSYVDAYFTGDLETFKAENPDIFSSRGANKGELKAPFQAAERMIERAERDPFFLSFLTGEQQVSLTGEIFGIKWRGTLDVLHDDKIVDLKTVKDIRGRYWTPDEGTLSLVKYWGYDIQGAIYRELVRQNTGKNLPFYLAMISKEQYPDLGIVRVEEYNLDFSLEWVRMNTQRIKDLLDGAIPLRCEKCDFCKETRELDLFSVINSDELI